MLKGIALGLAASLALVSLAASAETVNRMKSAPSTFFSDSMFVNKRPEGSVSLSPPPPPLAQQCFVGCGPIFGTFVIRRLEIANVQRG